MTKKQIIFSITAFFAALIITLIAAFPLNAVASKIIEDTTAKNRIDLRYDKINVTFFGAAASNIQTGNLVIKNIELDYNPVGLLFKRITFKADSPYGKFWSTGRSC